jgi:3-hydroxybutyryl-CoA dehydrogenase
MQYANNIKTVGVIGAGVMGNGIAQVAATAGYEVILNDLKQEALDKAIKQIEAFLEKSVEKGKLQTAEAQAILGRIRTTTDLREVKADLIIEAILENLALKQELISVLESVNEASAILATNTSTIPITRIAAKAARPGQIVGMHFFNPAPLMKLVEVIAGEMTKPEVAEAIFEVSQKMGKKPVHVKDEPGFIVNRVARPYYLEGLRIYEERIADFQDIDALMEATGFKMGPFKLMDLIGVETNHEVTKSLYEAFFHETRFRPSRVQQKKVDAGQFGRKNGRGFYMYDTI